MELESKEINIFTIRITTGNGCAEEAQIITVERN
jgi:hypothetical protein